MPLPLPYDRLPEVRGTVTRGDEPVSGAQVWWAGTDAGRSGQKAPEVCENGRPKVETSSRGSFVLAGERGFGILMPLLPFHCVHRWNVCIETGAETVSLPVFAFYGICGAGGPGQVFARCDLDGKESERCRWTTSAAEACSEAPCDEGAATGDRPEAARGP